jgi:hypothetical protein
VLGTFHARFGHDTIVKGLCNMLQDLWKMLPVELIACNVTGSKHDKVEREGKTANCPGGGGGGGGYCNSRVF